MKTAGNTVNEIVPLPTPREKAGPDGAEAEGPRWTPKGVVRRVGSDQGCIRDRRLNPLVPRVRCVKAT